MLIAQSPDVTLSVAYGDLCFVIVCMINHRHVSHRALKMVLTEKYWNSFQPVSLIMAVVAFYNDRNLLQNFRV